MNRPETEGFDMLALESLAKETGFSISLFDGDVPVVIGKRRREVTKMKDKGEYDLWNHMGSTPHLKDLTYRGKGH